MELYFNMFKIRYLVLDELVRDKLVYEPGEEINIFINIETILKKINRTIEDRENILNDQTRNLVLASCIFNLAAHYRNYFNKKQLCSKVYLYGPESIDTTYLNNIYLDTYRKNNCLSNLTHVTSIGDNYDKTLKVIKLLLEYVEGVYFITSGLIEPSVVPFIIDQDPNTHRNINIMVTDDRYEMQLVKENFIILKPRLEKSMLIDKENVLDVIKNKTKCENLETPDLNFLPFILSILGDEYRGIPKVNKIGISGIYKMIEKGIKDNIINSNVSSILSLLNIIDEKHHNQVRLNYLCTNIFEQYKRLSKVDKSIIFNQITDRYDGGYLKEMNDVYFIEHPLNILEINSGIKNKKKRIIKWR